LIVLTNDIVLDKAKSLGFDLVGFAPAEKLVFETGHLSEWLKRGYHSGMSYMEKNIHKRENVCELLPGAKSVISLGLNYYKEAGYSGNSEYGKISKYAGGKDYHLIIWEKLNVLISSLKEIDPSFEAVSFVDTGPVMDKAWAVRAGLGWMGKNTNIINPGIGSWFFIANIISTYEFSASLKIEDHCGTCNACIDACPTGALQDYVLDANKCISYLTIENKGNIPEEFTGKFEGWVFGCDICQDVCPWNQKFADESLLPEFEPVFRELELKKIVEMEQDEFSRTFKHSPVKRAKMAGLKRNAAFLKNKI
jgi:epoxyqueuosine reductase